MDKSSTEPNIVKEGLMTKRSQAKKKIVSKTNYKRRVFVLTPKELRYHEGSLEQKGKCKGTIDLSTVKVVDVVDDNAINRRHCFQVHYDEWTLYIIANSDEERNEWINSIRHEVTVHNKTTLLKNYHSGIYLSGQWSCCDGKSKAFPGCKVSQFYSEGSKAATTRGTRMGPLPQIPGSSSTTSLVAEAERNGVRESIRTMQVDRVIAIYDFDAMQPDDLSLHRDFHYKILDKSQKHWWLAEDEQGKQGYIPSNYVREIGGLESQEWFLGDLTRQEADELLQNEERDGTFLVRNSRQPGTYTLTLVFQGNVRHYHIKKDQDKFFVAQRHKFDTIPDLVNYHMHNSAGLVMRLRYPYTKGGVAPSTPGLGHDIFEIPREELQVCRQLGNGQFGAVHEGIWKNRKRVAIKMMREGTMSEDDFIEEAKVMARFQHKHLVKLFGICSKERPLYIVTELMSQGSLLEFLRTKKELQDEMSVLLEMIFQVCSAMAYLEGEKFIHRDLAARNCLVGERNIVKVCDFGLARLVLDDEYMASEGTKFPVKWAAPEVIHYTKFSSKSDVWAYGILCWEVFSGGKNPYSAMSNHQVADQVMRGYRLERPRKCPQEVYDLMMDCWDQDPAARPSFADLLIKVRSLTEDYN